MSVAVTVQGICRSVSATWITSLGRPDARSFAMPVPEGARRSGQQIDTRPRGTFAQARERDLVVFIGHLVTGSSRGGAPPLTSRKVRSRVN
jgi:hypothetical protein